MYNMKRGVEKMRKNNTFLEYVNQYHIKNFITYHKTSEKLYKWLKAIAIVAFVYQLFVNVILVLGLKFAKQPLESSITNNTIIATVFLGLAFIALLFKYGIIATLFNILSVIFEMSLMVPGLIKTAGAINIKGAFYWQYAIPMSIILIVTLWMGYISLRERYILWRDERVIKDALYRKFGLEIEKLDSKQIKDFINNFDPYKKIKEEK